MSKATTITKEYLDALRTAKLLDKDDVRKISELTATLNVRGPGKGYGKEQIRNFLLRECTATTEMIDIILGYFEEKKKMMDKMASRQSKFINQLV